MGKRALSVPVVLALVASVVVVAATVGVSPASAGSNPAGLSGFVRYDYDYASTNITATVDAAWTVTNGVVSAAGTRYNFEDGSCDLTYTGSGTAGDEETVGLTPGATSYTVSASSFNGTQTRSVVCADTSSTTEGPFTFPPAQAYDNPWGGPSFAETDVFFGSSTTTNSNGSATTTVSWLLYRDVCDSAVDSDGDGASDCDEVAAGTDPGDDTTFPPPPALPAISISDLTVVEDEAAAMAFVTLNMTLDQQALPLTRVTVTAVDGDATHGVDYELLGGVTHVRAAPEGSTRFPVTFTVALDSDPEDDETFSLVLSNPRNATIAVDTAVVTIEDDDSPPPDTTPPVLSLPADVIDTTNDPAGTTITYTATADDALDGPVPTSCTPASGSLFAVGDTTVTCTATDTAGNTATSSFTVTVELPPDTTDPVLSLPADINDTTQAATGKTVAFAATATDDRDGPIPATCTPASGTLFAIGTTTVNCTASDAAGNTATGSFTVTVTLAPDTTPPALNLPANITRTASDYNGLPITYAPTATDTRDGSLPVACVPSSGTRFAVGVTTVSCTATDSAGNTATGSFNVAIAEPPGGPIFDTRRRSRGRSGALSCQVGMRRPTQVRNTATRGTIRQANGRVTCRTNGLVPFGVAYVPAGINIRVTLQWQYRSGSRWRNVGSAREIFNVTPPSVGSGNVYLSPGLLRNVNGRDGTRVRVMIKVRAWDTAGSTWWRDRPSAVKRIR